MLDDTPTGPEAAGDTAEQPPAKKAAARKSAAKKATTPRRTAAKKTAPATEAGDAATAPVPDPAAPEAPASADEPAPAKKAAARKSTAKTAAKKSTTPRKTAAKKTAAPDTTAETPAADPAPSVEGEQQPAAASATTVTTTTRSTRKRTAKTAPSTSGDATATPAADTPAAELPAAAAVPLFQAPETTTAPARRTRSRAAAKPATDVSDAADAEATTEEAVETAAPTRSRSTQKRTPRAKPEATDEATDDEAESSATADSEQSADTEDTDDSESGEGPSRRRRRRGGRRRRKSGGDESGGDQQDSDGRDSGAQDDSGQKPEKSEKSGKADNDKSDKSDKNEDDRGSGDDKDSDDGDSGSTTRRRRRRRRAGEDGDNGDDDPQNTVTRVRKQRSAEDQITAVSGSTRLEAKKQRRREGREAGRRRAPIVSEAEFLARRESVERVMAIRQRDDLTQIAVLEDKVLVEHYVARESQTSLIGNVYLGRVQNVLPSMEAAFIDIGKGRNAVLYAGEVNWSSLGHKEGQPRKIESVLSSGQMILVQVTKDPVGHKGARLTSQISLAGRFLVYVPDGTNSGISRKLPDTERNRLKTLLKEIVPDGAGVIVRTAAEGASEEELTRDVERLRARWEDIEKKSANKGAGAQLLYGEPDLTLKVVRDLFTEDFSRLVIQGDDAWDTVHDYVAHVAPDLGERLEKYDGSQVDLFAKFRIDEQIHKGLDRKVWLPSGGSLVIDRTEAMTVVDVNTGKFTGSGGNLEETVTKNNLEAAEEIVRQLRLRDIGGIIVVDFIDMVLESNRDLVLRRLVECLGRDRTRHQVAEVTSLGLVQMTRKRIGTGLLEAFSENCEHCQGRGVVIADAPVEPKREQEPKRSTRRRGGKGRDDQDSAADHNGKQGGQQGGDASKAPSPKDVAAMARAAAHAEEDAAAPEAAADTETDTEAATPSEPDAAPQPEPQPEPVAEPVSSEPKVSTRTRSRTRPQTKARPEPEAEAEAQPEPQSEAEPVPETPTTEPEAQPEPAAEPAEPVAPKVVTRTRRRSASRPAGPPATPVAAEIPAPPTVTATAEPDGAPEAPPVPAMTPTGESGASGVVGAPPADGAVEPGTAETEVGTKPVVEHVPVKKRGSRKR